MTDLFQDTLPTPDDRKRTVYADGKPYLAEQCGIKLDSAGAMLTKWIKQYGDGEVREVLSQAMNARNSLADPKAWIMGALKQRKANAAPEPSEMEGAAVLAKIKHMEGFCATRPASPQAHKLLAELRAVAMRKGLG